MAIPSDYKYSLFFFFFFFVTQRHSCFYYFFLSLFSKRIELSFGYCCFLFHSFTFFWLDLHKNFVCHYSFLQKKNIKFAISFFFVIIIKNNPLYFFLFCISKLVMEMVNCKNFKITDSFFICCMLAFIYFFYMYTINNFE